MLDPGLGVKEVKLKQGQQLTRVWWRFYSDVVATTALHSEGRGRFHDFRKFQCMMKYLKLFLQCLKIPTYDEIFNVVFALFNPSSWELRCWKIWLLHNLFLPQNIN